MRGFIALFVFLQIGWKASGQTFELDKVTIEELQQQTHPLEPDAGAAILFENGTTFMDLSDEGFELVTQVDVKIKIYNEKGYDWGNKSILHYIGTNFKDKVDISRAVTYNLVNGKIEKTKLKSEGEFVEEINRYWALKKIAMPNVKSGSIIEFRYIIRSPDLGDIPVWRFQKSIPVNHSKYVTKIPNYYTFKTDFRGELPKIEESIANRMHTFITTYRPGENRLYRGGFVSDKVIFQEHIKTYTAENRPSISKERYVGNINNYVSSIAHEVAMTNFPHSGIKHYSQTWDDVVKNIYKSDEFGGELRKNAYFEADLNLLLANTASEKEKIAKIFSHVKNTMNWNGIQSSYCKGGVRKAYKEKVGNAAEINLILVAMLRAAGLNANPVLVSTRDNGISFFPNRMGFNYVVASVALDNEHIVMDATEKATIPNMLPVRALNWTGRIVKADGTSESINLTPQKLSKENVTMLCEIDQKGNLKGNVRSQYFDYNALEFRNVNKSLSKDNTIELVESQFPGIIVDNYNADQDDLSKPITESYSFTHDNASEIIAGKLYLSPLLFFTQNENFFKQEERKYPVDFIYPKERKFAFTIKIPEGYVVESLPGVTNVVMGNQLGTYKFNINVANNQIQVLSILTINESVIGPDDYLGLKAFFEKIVAKQNEKIVLKKA